MSYITLDYDAAQALKFVVSGTDKHDHTSVVFIDIEDGGKTTITTPFTSTRRSITLHAMEPEAGHFAVRSQALVSVAKKVDEDQNMVVTFKDDKISVTCGSTSATLSNLYPHIVDTRTQLSSQLVSHVEAYTALKAISAAATRANGSDGVVSIADDGQAMTVGAGTELLYTQELLPPTVSDGDSFRFDIFGTLMSKIKPLSKLECLDNMTMYAGTGFVTFEFPIVDDSCHLRNVSYTVPTVVSSVKHDDTPCDGDITPALSIDKSVLKESLNSIKGVVSGKAIVSLDSSQDGRVVLKVSDEESNGKTVIIQATVLSKTILTAPISSLIDAVSSTPSSPVEIGTVYYRGSEWIALKSDFDEEEDAGGDIVIAVKQLDIEE